MAFQNNILLRLRFKFEKTSVYLKIKKTCSLSIICGNLPVCSCFQRAQQFYWSDFFWSIWWGMLALPSPLHPVRYARPPLEAGGAHPPAESNPGSESECGAKNRARGIDSWSFFTLRYSTGPFPYMMIGSGAEGRGGGWQLLLSPVYTDWFVFIDERDNRLRARRSIGKWAYTRLIQMGMRGRAREWVTGNTHAALFCSFITVRESFFVLSIRWPNVINWYFACIILKLEGIAIFL